MKTTVSYKRITILLFAALLSVSAFSQTRPRMKKADKIYDRFSYIDARDIYIKVIEQGYRSPQLYEKLADTYYYNGQYEDASKYYDELFSIFPNED